MRAPLREEFLRLSPWLLQMKKTRSIGRSACVDNVVTGEGVCPLRGGTSPPSINTHSQYRQSESSPRLGPGCCFRVGDFVWMERNQCARIPSSILLVDDDPNSEVRPGSRAALESAGLHVKEFESSEEFISHYKGDEVGCVLLDLRHAGMSDVRLLRKLRDSKSSLPIIVIARSGELHRRRLPLFPHIRQPLVKPADRPVGQIGQQLCEIIAAGSALIGDCCRRRRRSSIRLT